MTLDADPQRLMPPLAALKGSIAAAEFVLRRTSNPGPVREAIEELIERAEDDDGGKLDFATLCIGVADTVAEELTKRLAPVRVFGSASTWLPLVGPLGPSPLDLVFATGALMAADRAIELQRTVGDFDAAFHAGMTAAQAGNLAMLTEMAIACSRLAGEAMFIAGRRDIERAMRAAESRSRSKRAALGGAATARFTDEELSAFCQGWIAKHRRTHGVRAAAAVHFNVSEAAIGKRLKRIRTR